jgi:demethylmenaquinone methyltransferase/2-methoxy-6-polyprenyl-1,4-benzoquinol methylase
MNAEALMEKYYAQRAPYYERVYHKPERQEDLRKLKEMVAAPVAGKTVLEVACGTGYWTEVVSRHAAFVLAMDVNEEVLEMARTKPISNGKAKFLRADAYAIPAAAETFDAALVGFWWSHVPKQKLQGFLHGLHRRLAKGACVIVFDNAFVEGNSTPLLRVDSDRNPISERDADGNTYQQRVLDDGTSYQIVKNYPTEEELRRDLKGIAADVQVSFLKYYWFLQYCTP